MGHKGLSAFISKKKNYFSDFELHSMTLVFDGNNIASTLYRLSAKSSFAFNGDYNSYAEEIKSFFTLFLDCNIKPIVILDGGYELRKLNAVQARLLLSTKEIGRFRREKNCDPILPLLMLDVFKETLLDMKILFAQSRFEADDDIVNVANYFKCPILSGDSDFYLRDVEFIPYSSLNFTPHRKNDSNEYNFLSCKMYYINRFLKDFGGIPDKSYLPLLALLLGNYLEIKHFKKLYISLKGDGGKSITHKMNNYSEILKTLFLWFREVDSFDTAAAMIIKSIPLQFKRFVCKQLKRILNEQQVPLRSPIVEFFSERMKDSPSFDELSSQLNALSISSNPSKSNELENSRSIACFSPTGQKLEIPEWYFNMEMRGIFSRHISNIINLKTVLLWTQIEEYNLPSAHIISLPILSAIAGILFSISRRHISINLTCYVRVGHDINKELLSAQYPLDLVSFNSIIFLPLSTRKSVLLKTLLAENFDSDSVPENWSLFLLTTLFWFKNKTPTTECIFFVGALVYSFLFLNLTSSTIAKIPKSITELGKKDHDGENFDQENKILNSNLKNVVNYTLEDDRFMNNFTKTFKKINEEKRPSKEISKLAIHFYAEFQTCFQCALALNSLLNFPLNPPCISKALSGSLIHELFNQIKSTSSLFHFTSHISCGDYITENLLLSALKFIEINVPCSIIHQDLNS